MWDRDDAGQAAVTDSNKIKSLSSERHSGGTVMMNADWIYKGSKWVWTGERLDKLGWVGVS